MAKMIRANKNLEAKVLRDFVSIGSLVSVKEK